MVVSGGTNQFNGLIEATSVTSFSWTTLANGNNGVILSSPAGAWDENLEAPELIKTGSTYRLFYAGYRESARDCVPGEQLCWGDLGIATSTNGTAFTKYGSNPVMSRTPGWWDQNGIFDPTIVQAGSTLYMIDVGWCTVSCTINGGQIAISMLSAVSTNN